MKGSTSTDELTQLQDEEILALVHTRTRRFRRQVRFRDWRELIASAVVAVMIAPATLHGSIISRTGAVIILIGLVLVAYRLWRARQFFTANDFDPALPVAVALEAELKQVDAQIHLLESVAWWYVAPLLGGSIILVAGTHRGAAFTAGYAFIVACLAWGIIALNRRAVRGTLRPRRADIVRLLAQIAS